MRLPPHRPGRSLAALLSGLALAWSAPGAAGQAVHFGQPCSGLFPPPTIAYWGSVVPDQWASLRLEGARPGGLVVLHAGRSNDAFPNGVPLPFDVSFVQGVPEGCWQYTSAEIVLILNALPDGSLQIDFPVPLIFGSDMYFQWFVVEQLQPLAVACTEAVHVSVNTNPDMHVVMHVPDVVVDWDDDGAEDVLLDGSDSHTHQVGSSLTAWDWREGLAKLAQSAVATVPLDVGSHLVSLRISDDEDPVNTLMDVATIEVVPPDAVPGVGVRLHDAGGRVPAAWLDAPPAAADWAATAPAFEVGAEGGGVAGSPYAGGVLVRLAGAVDLPAAADAVAAYGGADRRLLVDGAPVAGRVPLSAGSHQIEARFAVDDLADLPVGVSFLVGGQPLAGLSPAHDATLDGPVLNAVTPELGSSAGGNAVVLTGAGFFPAQDVVVHWGGLDLGLGDNLSLSADRIAFSAPPHAAGPVAVTVETPRGVSNARTFTYDDDGPVPVDFAFVGAVPVPGPTSGDWGPDGRFYVTTIGGELVALTFADDLSITDVQTYPGVSGETNHQSLGLAFDPFDPPDPVRVYVGHALLSADGGGAVTAPSAYLGAVSVLTGPDFDDPQPVVTGLPQPNTAHQVNGLLFDNNGDLLINVGACTNAGVPWITIGSLPESPLSAAVLKAATSRRDFDGAVGYVFTDGGLPSTDQRDGGLVDVAPGSHVAVHAAGLRNPYDLVLTTGGRVYATDNGPNSTYGPPSTGAATQGGDAEAPDELLLVERGLYYGHPNRSRGRTDPRQDVYHGPYGPGLPETFRQTLTVLTSSVDGITEYRSATFGGQMRGELLAQKWSGPALRVRLAPDGRAVDSVLTLVPGTVALDLAMAPGGGLVTVHYSDDAVGAFVPVDAAAGRGLRVLDITPWRAPDTGGHPFVLGGEGFSALGDTTVTIGGTPATLTAVRPTRIEGQLPARPAASTDLLDVAVVSGGQADLLPGAFRYLLTPRGREPGRWEPGEALPDGAAGTAGAVVHGTLYLFSHDTPDTLRLDLLAGGWDTGAAPRPLPAGGHGAAVLGEMIYLVGGEGAAAGKVQVYDHHADLWSLGPDLPWAASAPATAALGGRLYAAGGAVGGVPAGDAAVFDPAAGTWSPLPPVPAGAARAGAAAGTDGARLFLFGGLDAAGDPTATVSIYDPAGAAWTTSSDLGGPLAPMPTARHDTSRAVWLADELYVVGGLGTAGPVAAVEAFDPATGGWRAEADLPTPRSGIAPVLFEGRAWVAGGATGPAHVHSGAVEVFARP